MIPDNKKLAQYMPQIDQLMSMIAPALTEVTDILERSGMDVYYIELSHGEKVGNWRWVSSNYYRPPKVDPNQRRVDGIEGDLL